MKILTNENYTLNLLELKYIYFGHKMFEKILKHALFWSVRVKKKIKWWILFDLFVFVFLLALTTFSMALKFTVNFMTPPLQKFSSFPSFSSVPSSSFSFFALTTILSITKGLIFLISTGICPRLDLERIFSFGISIG